MQTAHLKGIIYLSAIKCFIALNHLYETVRDYPSPPPPMAQRFRQTILHILSPQMYTNVKIVILYKNAHRS